jgi:hypothetical protein
VMMWMLMMNGQIRVPGDDPSFCFYSASYYLFSHMDAYKGFGIIIGQTGIPIYFKDASLSSYTIQLDFNLHVLHHPKVLGLLKMCCTD